VLHAKPRPFGRWSRCSIQRGISDSPALLLCPTRAVLPQTPTPQNRRISMGQALKARDPQTFTISTRPRPQGLLHWRYKHAPSPFCWATTPRLAQPCTIFTPQACAPKACQARDPHMHDLCSAGPRPPSLSSPGSIDTQVLHSAGLRPSGTPGSRSKGLLPHLS
jgi:hypothetical protein